MEMENADSVVGIDPPLDWSSPLTLPSPQRGEGYLRKEPSPPVGERAAVRAETLASGGEARAE